MKLWIKISAMCLLFFVVSSGAVALAKNLVIVVNSHVPVTELSQHEVAQYFLKKKRFWDDGVPVRPIDWTEGYKTRQLFLASVLKMNENQLAQYWFGQKLSTGSHPPLSVDSGDTLCEFLFSIEGSIGYFEEDSAALLNCVEVKRVGVIKVQ